MRLPLTAKQRGHSQFSAAFSEVEGTPSFLNLRLHLTSRILSCPGVLTLSPSLPPALLICAVLSSDLWKLGSVLRPLFFSLQISFLLFIELHGSHVHGQIRDAPGSVGLEIQLPTARLHLDVNTHLKLNVSQTGVAVSLSLSHLAFPSQWMIPPPFT